MTTKRIKKILLIMRLPLLALKLNRLSGDVLSPPVHFDFDYYSELANLSFESKTSAWMHYLLVGRDLGIRPIQSFDADFYLERYPDVAESGLDPFYHFATHGIEEGRIAELPESVKRMLGAFGGNHNPVNSKISNFSEVVGVPPDEYLSPKIVARSFGPISPRSDFSGLEYGWLNPDVETAEVNAYHHWTHQAGPEMRRHSAPDALFLKHVPVEMDRVSIRKMWRQSTPTAAAITSRKTATRKLQDYMNQSRLNIMNVTHDDPTINQGGIQRFLRERIKSSAHRGIQSSFLVPARPSPMRESGDEVLKLLDADGDLLVTIRTSEILELFYEFDTCNLGVSINCLNGHNLEILVDQCLGFRNAKIQVIFHDASWICESHNLSWQGIRYCGAPSLKSVACANCVHGGSRDSVLSQSRRALKKLATRNAEFWAPSTHMANLVRDSLLFDSAIAPHNIFVADGVVVRRCDPEDRISIGYMGSPSAAKGWLDFVAISTAAAHDRRLKFVHLGTETETFPWNSNIRHVSYADSESDTVELLVSEEVDVLLVAPRGNESYSYVAQDAISAGVFVQTTTKKSAVFEIASRYSADLEVVSIEELQRLGRDRELYEHLAKQIRRPISRGTFSSNPMTVDWLA